MDIPKILQIIRPNAEYAIRGNTLDDVEWLDSVQVKPTQVEMDTGQLQVDDLAYRDLRKDAYPPLGDQFDAIWKVLQKLKDDGTDIGTAGDAMKTLIDDVKTQYPKP